MKKIYVSPLAVEVNVETENILAASIGFGEGEVDAGGSYSAGRRGQWGDLWKRE